MQIVDPVLHSHIEDVLPDKHKLASTNVYCCVCNEMLHCENNECMQTWIETGKGNYCIRCFAGLDDAAALRGEYGLRIEDSSVPK